MAGATGRGRALRAGGSAVIVVLSIVLACVAGPGLAARGGAEPPLDDAVTGAPFLSWALEGVRARSGAGAFVSVAVDRAELELTVRAGGEDELWRVRPQSLPQLVTSSRPPDGELTGEFSQLDADGLSRAWSRYASSMTACGEEYTHLDASAGAADEARVSVHCTRGEPGELMVQTVQDWVGTRIVQVQTGLGTASAMGSVLGDLERLTPAAGAAVIRLTDDEELCGAQALWPEDTRGEGGPEDTRGTSGPASTGSASSSASTGSTPSESDGAGGASGPESPRGHGPDRFRCHSRAALARPVAALLGRRSRVGQGAAHRHRQAR